MNKIRNYILNGKGIAAKYLAILSLILTIVITIFFSIIYNVAAEKIGVVPTRIGEIKIENGVIVSPEKQLIRDAFVFDDNMQLPLIIDTRTDSINTASLGTGVYLSRSKIYVKSDRKTEIYDYPEALTIEKRDYTDDIKNYNALQLTFLSSHFSLSCFGCFFIQCCSALFPISFQPLSKSLLFLNSA